MKLTQDMAVFDDHLPIGAKLMGYALGSTLMIAAHIGHVISAFIYSTPQYSQGSRQKSTWLEPKRLTHGK